MRVDAIVVLIGFVFDRPIMPISLQLGNAALVLLCKFIGVPSLAGSSTTLQSKRFWRDPVERHRGRVSQLSIRVVEWNDALDVSR
jgi:hypothetical protein